MNTFKLATFMSLLTLVALAGAASATVYVDMDNAGGTQTGADWATAYATVQQGVDGAFAAGEGEVWVAAGTYAGSITLKSGVRVYGGFSGAETGLAQRAIDGNLTVLDGALADHAVVMDNVTNARLDGFSVTGGAATTGYSLTGYGDMGVGGGIFCQSADETNVIAYCKVYGNQAEASGAGIFCRDASPTIINSDICGNFATGSYPFETGGGGLCAVEYSSPSVVNTTISANQGNYGGGVLCFDGSSPTLTNCVISGNRAEMAGGGVACGLNSSPTITNCTISSNSAVTGGGLTSGWYLTLQPAGNCHPVIINTVFAFNSHYALYERTTDSDPTVAYCLFYGNQHGDYFDEHMTGYTGAAAINASVAEASHISDGDPAFLAAQSGVWNVAPSYDANTNRTTLTASTGSFQADALVGLVINTDASQRRQALIAANTSSTVEVLGDVTAYTSAGDAYALVNYSIAANSACVDAGTDGTDVGRAVPSADINGQARPFDCPGIDNNGALADYDIGAVECSSSEVGNAPPVATGDAYQVSAAGTLVMAAPGVLSNDTDAEQSALTAHLVTDVQHGTLALSADGSFTYQHDGTSATSDSFIYVAYDGAAYSSTPATVAITVLQQSMGPLRVSPDNPRYFCDATGKAVLLTGSHVWYNLVDMGTTDPPAAFDFDAYLGFLKARNHNFIRLWAWELVTANTTHNVTPHPWARTGAGTALDGKPNFDLQTFDTEYFDRLRSRVQAAQQEGIYVSVMLFEGYGLQFEPSGWQKHPFNPGNNVNAVTDALGSEPNGLALHTLTYPDVTALQEGYIRKVIDTLNDLDNVLYEIANESNPGSTAWQYHMIDYIRAYEQGKAKQHPIGMTFQYQGGSNQTLFDSPADWISPNYEGGYQTNPPANDGRKVILTDSDHLWGIGGDQAWVWKSVLRGLNPIFMDPYDGGLLGSPFDATWDPIRESMGYALSLTEQMSLTDMVPENALASTTYCLADRGNEYLVYLPSGGSVTVDLAEVPGAASVEWFNPNTGETLTSADVQGGSTCALTSPFGAVDALLNLRALAVTNHPPVLNSIGDKQVTAGESLQFTISASDPDGDTLTYSASSLPSGAAFDANTRTFSWTPASTAVGTYSNVQFSVADNASPALSDSESITITVVASASSGNNPPVLEPIGDKQIQPSGYLDFIVNASDPDPYDSVTYTVSNLPAGAQWWAGAHRVTWATTSADAGVYENVVFTATDRGTPALSVSESITITVGEAPTENQAPILATIGDKQVNEGQTLQFVVTASDPDAGDTLALSARGLPSGASFTATTGAFSWTPSFDAVGAYSITFMVSDSGASVLTDSEVITINVIDVNRAPVLNAIGSRQVDEGQSLQFSVTASDPDTGDALTLSASGLPASATFAAASGAFAWTPGFDAAGTYSVTFTVSDSAGLTDSETIAIAVVDVNRPPVLSAIGAKSGLEGQLLQFAVTASDPDAGDNCVCSVSNLPSGATFDAVSGAFAWTPNTGDAGTYTNVVFTVADSGSPSLSDSEAIAIAIEPPDNRAPVFEPIGDKSVTAGAYLDITVNASDPDSLQVLTYSVSNLPAGAEWWPGARRLTWSTTAADKGDYVVTFVVTDNGSPALSASETITIQVTGSNSAPVLAAIGSKEISVDETLQFTVSASDPDGDSLTFSAAGLPAGAVFDTASRTFSWNPGTADVGTHNVSFTVTDAAVPPLSDSETISITVKDLVSNHAPVMDPIGDKVVKVGEYLDFVVTATDPDQYDALKYSVSNLPAGAKWWQGAHRLTWAPEDRDVGVYSDVVFSVTDNAKPRLSDSRTITIIVEENAGSTLYVDSAKKSAAADGSSAYPFGTITEALDSAVEGRCDTIVVAPGQYAEELVLKPNVTLVGETGAADTHLVSTTPKGTVVTMADGSALRGFTIGQTSGVAVSVPSDVLVDVTNCAIHSSGTGLYVAENALVECVNNVFVANDYGVFAEPGAIFSALKNSIFEANGVAVSTDQEAIAAGGYNVFNGNEVDLEGPAADPTDLWVDPLFVDAAALDFRLLEASPCLDAGDPDNLYADGDGSINDIGAAGGYYSIPVDALLVADVNEDGSVDAMDIQMLINAALNLGAPEYNCDVNSDGFVDAIDIQSGINAALGL